MERKKISSILLMEPDLELLFYLINNLDISLFNNRIQFYIYFNTNFRIDNLENILSYFKNKDLNSIIIYSHRAAFHSFYDDYNSIKIKLLKLIEKRRINQNTLIKFEYLWNKNILLNSTEILESNSLNNILNLIFLPNSGCTILLVGAGPSLDKHIQHIIKYRGKFIICCADTAYIPLLKYNIIPDIVFCSDPQWINHHFVLHKYVSKSLWALDPAVNYVIPHWLQKNKAKMFFWDNPFLLDKLITNQYGVRGEIEHGGSVSTNIFNFAIKANASTIILLAQDLCFSQKRAHTKGSILEEMMYNNNNRFQSMENHNYKQLSAMDKVYIDRIGEQSPCFTNPKLKVFIEWFEYQVPYWENKKNDLKIFRTDYEGVSLKNVVYQDIETILLNLNQNSNHKTHNIHILLDKYLNQNINKQEISISFFNNLKNEILILQNLYLKNRVLSQELSTMKENRNTYLLIQEKIHCLNQNDEKITKYKQSNEVLSLSAQTIILNINENKVTSNNVWSNSYQLYSAMLQATKILLYLLKKYP